MKKMATNAESHAFWTQKVEKRIQVCFCWREVVLHQLNTRQMIWSLGMTGVEEIDTELALEILTMGVLQNISNNSPAAWAWYQYQQQTLNGLGYRLCNGEKNRTLVLGFDESSTLLEKEVEVDGNPGKSPSLFEACWEKSDTRNHSKIGVLRIFLLPLRGLSKLSFSSACTRDNCGWSSPLFVLAMVVSKSQFSNIRQAVLNIQMTIYKSSWAGKKGLIWRNVFVVFLSSLLVSLFVEFDSLFSIYNRVCFVFVLNGPIVLSGFSWVEKNVQFDLIIVEVLFNVWLLWVLYFLHVFT